MRRSLPLALTLAWLCATGAGAHPFESFGLEELMPPTQGRLGVQLQSMTPELREFMRAPEDRGVLVVRISKDSAAEKAGLRVGDVIVAIDGEAARDTRDVVQPVLRAEENAALEIEIVRDGEARTLSAVVAGKPAVPFSRSEPMRWLERELPGLGAELEKRMGELEQRFEELEGRLKDQLKAKPERET